jgi:hypothetical protein
VSAPRNYSVQVPTPAATLEFGVRPPVCRLRLVHVGRIQPMFRLRLVGL